MISKTEEQILKYQQGKERMLKKAEQYDSKIDALKTKRHAELGAELEQVGLNKLGISELQSVLQLAKLAVNHDLHKLDEQAMAETLSNIANQKT